MGDAGILRDLNATGFEVMLKGVGHRGAVPVLALGSTLLVYLSTHTALTHPDTP